MALLQEAKAGRHFDTIAAICLSLLPDRDDVEESAGWLLEEACPAQPAEFVAFLAKQGSLASRLALRYAAEKLRPEHRVLVLG